MLFSIVGPEWRNWQTRRTQNPVAARPCGFDSLLEHHFQTLLRIAPLTLTPSFSPVIFACPHEAARGYSGDTQAAVFSAFGPIWRIVGGLALSGKHANGGA